MKSTYLTETLFSTTVLRLDFTAITVQLTHGGACASHGNPDETCDLVECKYHVGEGIFPSRFFVIAITVWADTLGGL